MFKTIRKICFMNNVRKTFSEMFSSNESISKERQSIYKEEINTINEKLEDENLSKRERRRLKKEKQRAVDGLEKMDDENKNFILKGLLCIGTIIGVVKLIK